MPCLHVWPEVEASQTVTVMVERARSSGREGTTATHVSSVACHHSRSATVDDYLGRGRLSTTENDQSEAHVLANLVNLNYAPSSFGHAGLQGH